MILTKPVAHKNRESLHDKWKLVAAILGLPEAKPMLSLKAARAILRWAFLANRKASVNFNTLDTCC